MHFITLEDDRMASIISSAAAASQTFLADTKNVAVDHILIRGMQHELGVVAGLSMDPERPSAEIFESLVTVMTFALIYATALASGTLTTATPLPEGT